MTTDTIKFKNKVKIDKSEFEDLDEMLSYFLLKSDNFKIEETNKEEKKAIKNLRWFKKLKNSLKNV